LAILYLPSKQKKLKKVITFPLFQKLRHW